MDPGVCVLPWLPSFEFRVGSLCGGLHVYSRPTTQLFCQHSYNNSQLLCKAQFGHFNCYSTHLRQFIFCGLKGFYNVMDSVMFRRRAAGLVPLPAALSSALSFRCTIRKQCCGFLWQAYPRPRVKDNTRITFHHFFRFEWFSRHGCTLPLHPEEGGPVPVVNDGPNDLWLVTSYLYRSCYTVYSIC